MPRVNLPVSLHTAAFQLRKKLLKRAPMQDLLNYHREHQEFLAKITPLVNVRRLPLSDRFAWKFLREVNILSLDFTIENASQGVISRTATSKGQGIYVNLEEVVQHVQRIWFPEMDGPPSVVWLKRFSTRKLAHYSYKLDEIAVSLIFDTIDVPAEIVSYLAYHELLHRQLGAKTVNGRRYAHTGEFKHQEHLFPNWRGMDDQINTYILNTG